MRITAKVSIVHVDTPEVLHKRAANAALPQVKLMFACCVNTPAKETVCDCLPQTSLGAQVTRLRPTSKQPAAGPDGLGRRHYSKVFSGCCFFPLCVRREAAMLDCGFRKPK